MEVKITYSEDKVIESRADKVARLKLEMDSGLLSKFDALKEVAGQFNSGANALLQAKQAAVPSSAPV